MTLTGIMPGDDDHRDPDRRAIRALHDELQDMGRRFERFSERLDSVADSLSDLRQVQRTVEVLVAIRDRLEGLETLIRGNGEEGIVARMGRMDERIRGLEGVDDAAKDSRSGIYSRLREVEASLAGLKGSAVIWGSLAASIVAAVVSWLLGGGS